MNPLGSSQESVRATFVCGKCRHEYSWSSESVGKSARCSCGQVIRVPATPQASPQGTRPTAQFAVGTAANPSFVPSDMAPPSMGALVSALAVPTPAVAASAAGVTRAIHSGDDHEPLDPALVRELTADGLIAKEGIEHAYNEFRDKQFPLYLLGAGFFILVTQIVVSSQGGAGTLIAVSLAMAVSLVVNVALMLGGVLLAARFAGISFGNLSAALLKLSAICVGPTALGNFIGELLGGDMAVQTLGWGVSIFLYYVLISYLFVLDGGQTITCVLAIFIVRLIAGTLAAIIGVGIVAHQINSAVDDIGDQQAEQVVGVDAD